MPKGTWPPAHLAMRFDDIDVVGTGCPPRNRGQVCEALDFARANRARRLAAPRATDDRIGRMCALKTLAYDQWRDAPGPAA